MEGNYRELQFVVGRRRGEGREGERDIIKEGNTIECITLHRYIRRMRGGGNIMIKEMQGRKK